MSTPYVTDPSPSYSARNWLKLGVAALALAGLFSILIVFARTPAFATIPALKDFFHVALVVHVDLSVLVWFLAVAGMLFGSLRPCPIPYVACSAFWSMAAGTVLIAASPFFGQGEPLMSNYVPVLTNPAFFLGLGLVMAGALLAAFGVLLSPEARTLKLKSLFSSQADHGAVHQFGIISAGAILVISLACFYWTSQSLGSGHSDGSPLSQEYYEQLFWGGGHVLQFVHVQLMMVAWMALASAIHLPLRLRPRMLAVLYGLGLLAACTAPFGYYLYDVDTSEHKAFFTQLMIAANGLAPVGLCGALFMALVSLKAVPRTERALWSCLWMSLILFAFGGILGMAIRGQNVTIPAHYHGSIVGVTLAFMGLAYVMLPKFGYRSVAETRLAFWQPFVYGAGQLIHISALAWSGGYGVLRKTPGALEGGFTAAKAAMGIMGLGGLIAIIGGLMFVIVMFRAMQGDVPPKSEKTHGA